MVTRTNKARDFLHVSTRQIADGLTRLYETWQGKETIKYGLDFFGYLNHNRLKNANAADLEETGYCVVTLNNGIATP